MLILQIIIFLFLSVNADELCDRFDVLCVSDEDIGESYFSSLQEAIDQVVPLSPYNYIYLKKDVDTKGEGVIVDFNNKKGRKGKPVVVATHPDYSRKTISYGGVSPSDYYKFLLEVKSPYWTFQDLEFSVGKTNTVSNISYIVHINSGGTKFYDIDIYIGSANYIPGEDRIYFFLVRCVENCNDENFADIVVKNVDITCSSKIYQVFLLSSAATSSSDNVLDISDFKINSKCKMFIGVPGKLFEEDYDLKETGNGMEKVFVRNTDFSAGCTNLIQNDQTEDITVFDNLTIQSIKVVAPSIIKNSVIYKNLKIYHYNEISIIDNTFETCDGKCIIVDSGILTISGNTFKDVSGVAISPSLYKNSGSTLIDRNVFILNGGALFDIIKTNSLHDITFTNNFVDNTNGGRSYFFDIDLSNSFVLTIQNNLFLGDDSTLVYALCSSGGTVFSGFDVQNNIFSDFSSSLAWIETSGCTSIGNTDLSSNLIDVLSINWGSSGNGTNFYVSSIDWWGRGDDPFPYYTLHNSKYSGVINSNTPDYDFFYDPIPEDYVLPGPVQKIRCLGMSSFDDDLETCVCDNDLSYPSECEQCTTVFEEDCSCKNHYDESSDCSVCLTGYDISSECTTCSERRDLDNDCACLERYTGDDCNSCSSPNYSFDGDCLYCLKGYDIDSECVECLPNYKDAECTVCQEGFDITNECQSCSTNRDSSTNCQECINKYTLESNCSVCSFGYDIKKDCSDCINSDYDKEDDCKSCVKPNYDKNKNCTNCLDKYDINNDCLSCINNYDISQDCTVCLNEYDIDSECSECREGYDINTNCIECKEGYDINDDCLTCLNNYDIEEDCLVCKTGYDINTDCSECTEGYDINEDCLSCLNNFDIEKDCQECKEGYNFDSSCTVCKQNYDINNDCLTCVNNYDKYQNCSVCKYGYSSESDCKTCKFGYDIEAECSQCKIGYDNENDCLTCKTNYNSTLNCSVCVDGYNIEDDCNSCKFGYNVETSCRECYEGYDESNDCSTCLNNYNISENCEVCLFGYNITLDCAVCKIGYDPDQDCKKCIKNNFDENMDCNECYDGYEYVDGECEKGFFFSREVLIPVIIGSGSVVCLIFLVVIALFITTVILLVRKKKKNDDVDMSDFTGKSSFTPEKGGACLQVNSNLFEIDLKELKILSDIGSGGGGAVVYLAEWNNSEVAYKVFKYNHLLENDEDFSEFEKEVKVMASISHPNILRFYGCTLKPPKIGIVMEYCEKGDLCSYVTNNAVLKKTKWKIMFGVAKGMCYLHSRSIIHRDLKPENILLDKSLSPKITDFGVSRIVNKTNSVKMTTRVGTVYYMAPELVSGNQYDNSVDVFSFGIMLYMVLLDIWDPYGPPKNIVGSIELKVAQNPSFRPKFPKKKKLPFWAKKLIQTCWDHDYKKRPTFAGIISQIKRNLEIVEEGDKYLQKKNEQKKDFVIYRRKNKKEKK